MPKLVILHTYNGEGALCMLEALPKAVYLPGLFMMEELNVSFLKKLIG